MASAIIMPKAGMAMESGIIVAWLKKEGDPISVGEPILEIETDKVVMEVEAEVSGVLLAITHHEGDEVPVTQTIGYIGSEGESIAELLRDAPPAAVEAASTEEPVSPATPVTSPGDVARRADATSASANVAHASRVDTNARGVVRATPAARRLAAEHEIHLTSVTPTGLSGEVTGSDLLALVVARAAPTGGHVVSGRREPLSPMRRAIAAAMTRSAQIPQYTLHADANVDGLFALRAEIEAGQGTRVGVTTLVVRALGLALADSPAFAAFLDGDSLVHPDQMGIGLAISVPGGILVPVIHNVPTLTITQLDEEIRRFVAAAQAGQITADELDGAVTTVSNLGSLGVTRFTPMITPPQSSVVGVSALRSVPAVVDGILVERRVLGLDLTVDHRATDGAEAAGFLGLIIGFLESPKSLVE